MEISKQIDIKDKLGMESVFAEWTFLGKKHTSQSVKIFVAAYGLIKIKLDSEDGTLILDRSTILSDPEFKIEFFLK